MGLFQQLTEKPWLTAEGSVVDLHHRRAFDLPTVKLGLRVFLVVVTVVFSLIVITYADRMVLGDWGSLPKLWVLWLNTGILIASSVALQRAWVSARRGQIEGVRAGLFQAGVLSFAFLAGQLWAWQQLAALGYFAATNPASAYFYLITALHGLHLLGGLVAWGRTTAKVRRGWEADQVRLSVELCAIYWHFLLVVWVVLFGLLLFS